MGKGNNSRKERIKTKLNRFYFYDKETGKMLEGKYILVGVISLFLILSILTSVSVVITNHTITGKVEARLEINELEQEIIEITEELDGIRNEVKSKEEETNKLTEDLLEVEKEYVSKIEELEVAIDKIEKEVVELLGEN